MILSSFILIPNPRSHGIFISICDLILYDFDYLSMIPKSHVDINNDILYL